MDKKQITLATIGGAVLMAVILTVAERFTTDTVDAIDAGQEAVLAKTINTAINSALDEREKVVINGTTMTTAEALSMIATDQAVMKQQMEALLE